MNSKDFNEKDILDALKKILGPGVEIKAIRVDKNGKPDIEHLLNGLSSEQRSSVNHERDFIEDIMKISESYDKGPLDTVMAITSQFYANYGMNHHVTDDKKLFDDMKDLGMKACEAIVKEIGTSDMDRVFLALMFSLVAAGQLEESLNHKNKTNKNTNTTKSSITEAFAKEQDEAHDEELVRDILNLIKKSK